MVDIGKWDKEGFGNYLSSYGGMQPMVVVASESYSHTRNVLVLTQRSLQQPQSLLGILLYTL